MPNSLTDFLGGLKGRLVYLRLYLNVTILSVIRKMATKSGRKYYGTKFRTTTIYCAGVFYQFAPSFNRTNTNN